MSSTLTGKKKSTLLAMPSENPLVPGHWSQKPWLRTVMGIIVAQGLFLFLRRCFEAHHLYTMTAELERLQQWREQAGFFTRYLVEERIQAARSMWGGETAFFIWQGLQIVALLLGGILAGAGQKAGWQYGGVIGLINGFISLFQLLPYKPNVPEVYLFAQPLLYVAVGVLGSVIGAWFWPPLVAASSEDLRKAKEVRPPWWKFLLGVFDFKRLKVHWVKSLLCAVVAAAGVIFMEQAYVYLVGKLQIAEVLRKRGINREYVIIIMTWLWVFMSAMAAGASTHHGWIQGFWVGVLTGPVFIAISALDESKGMTTTVPTLLGTFLALGIAGGSFGARLLPPVIKNKHREGLRMTGI
jgi:hypothetical protein